jgi:hypothetical protein
MTTAPRQVLWTITNEGCNFTALQVAKEFGQSHWNHPIRHPESKSLTGGWHSLRRGMPGLAYAGTFRINGGARIYYLSLDNATDLWTVSVDVEA